LFAQRGLVAFKGRIVKQAISFIMERLSEFFIEKISGSYYNKRHIVGKTPCFAGKFS